MMPSMQYVLRNWALILLYKEEELQQNRLLRNEINRLLTLKATGRENEFIAAMRKAKAFRKYLESIWKEVL